MWVPWFLPLSWALPVPPGTKKGVLRALRGSKGCVCNETPAKDIPNRTADLLVLLNFVSPPEMSTEPGEAVQLGCLQSAQQARSRCPRPLNKARETRTAPAAVVRDPLTPSQFNRLFSYRVRCCVPAGLATTRSVTRSRKRPCSTMPARLSNAPAMHSGSSMGPN